MNHDLPAWLKVAVENLLDGQAGKAIADASSRVTALYRDGKASAVAIVSQLEASAYVAARMPATFAAVSAALHETMKRCPDFEPASLIDVGAGPGTASLAASGMLPKLQHVTLLDHNAAFLALAREIGSQSPAAAIRMATIEEADITRLGPAQNADLVIAAYSMVELRAEALTSFTLSLWQACEGVLLIVEPGTPVGYRNLMMARHALIEAGAFIAAPCPGSVGCPLVAPDWCHFSQRLSRTKMHIQAKGASVPFEDEKFSYVAVSRQPPHRTANRILSPPLENKAGLTLKLCTSAGLSIEVLPSRDRQRFKAARKLKWGECLEI